MNERDSNVVDLAAWLEILGKLYDRDLDIACDPNGYITSIVDVTLDDE